jgi:hypothetical protein
MAHQSGSIRFRARFESALQTYQETTGITLAEHPLTLQLQNLRPIEFITAILIYEARVSESRLGSDRIMKVIESTVSTLSTLSTTASFRDAIVLVRRKAVIVCLHIPE